ncbi:uncharacterized protein LOC144149664 [Haemaphysalis longicornis]
MVALLLHINSRETFTVPSRTDLPQQWGKAQKGGVTSKYEPKKIVDLPSSKRVTKEPIKLPDGDILERLLHGLPYTPSALSHSEFRSVSASTAIVSRSLETSSATAEESCYEAQQQQLPNAETRYG